MKQLTVFFALSLLTIAALAQNFSGGTGTQADPYKIGTALDLITLSKLNTTAAQIYWTKHYIITANIDFGEDEKLVDWDNDGTATWDAGDQKGFSPIGDNPSYDISRNGVAFTGSLNGKGHIISNLYINRNENQLGLLGYIGSNSSIDSIGVANATIKGVTSGVMCAPLVGYMKDNTKISNSFAVGGSINGYLYVGGLTGGAEGGCAILNCYASVHVSGSNSVGGLLGYGSANVQVKDCYATGKVDGPCDIGGLIGFKYGSLPTGSYWDKETTGKVLPSGYSYSGVIELTSKEFSNSGKFSNWSFANTWKMAGNKYDTYIRPRLKWETTSAVCLTPMDLSTTNTTAEGATLAWIEFGSANSWIVEYGTKGFTQGSGTQVAVNEKTMNLIGLSSFAEYDFYVRAVCGLGDSSNWSKPLTFRTLPEFVKFNSGTKNDPYEINTLADLHQLSLTPALWNANYVLTSDIDATETKASPIYNNGGKGFSPIGDEPGYGQRQRIAFTGSFNGNGHSISNLYINQESHYYNDNLGRSIGLFGYIFSGALIENIGLINPTVIGDYASGTLVGYFVGNAKIANSFTIGGTIRGNNYVGGLVGRVEYGTIENCYGSTKVNGSNKSGGLVGYFGLSSNMLSCYAAGKVSGSSLTGGLVGETYFNNASIINSYWDVDSTNQTSGGAYVNNTNNLIINVHGYNTSNFSNPGNFIFDFDNVWHIGTIAGDNNIRPRLRWQIFNKAYAIVYNGNGNTNGSLPIDVNNPYINGASVTVLDTLEHFSKKGYDYLGWNTKNNGLGIDYIAGNSFNISDIVTLYAKWNPINYIITYHNIGLVTNLNPKTYTIEDKIKLRELNSYDSSNYVFKGWYTNELFTHKIDSIDKGSIGNLDIYAKWVPDGDAIFSADTFSIQSKSPTCYSNKDGRIIILSKLFAVDVTIQELNLSFKVITNSPYSVNNLEPGTYHLKVSVGETNRNFIVQVHPIPAVKSSAIVKGNSVSINIEGGQPPYAIKIGDNCYTTQTGQLTVNNLKSGSYSAIIQDKNYCTEDTKLNFDIDYLKVFPNPIEDGKLQISLPSSLEGNIYHVKIININGVTLFFKSCTAIDNHIVLDVSSLLSGMYILEVKCDSFQETIQFIVK